jgi:hypothetical protein
MTTSFGPKAWHLNFGQQLQTITFAVYATNTLQARRCLDVLKGTAVSEVLIPVPPARVVERDPNALANWQLKVVENSSAILSHDLRSVTEQIVRSADRFSNGETISRILERHGITPELISEVKHVGFFEEEEVQDFLDSLEVAHDNSWAADVLRQDVDMSVYFGDHGHDAVNVWQMPVNTSFAEETDEEISSGILDFEVVSTLDKAMASRGVEPENVHIVDEVAEELFVMTSALGKLETKTAQVYWSSVVDVFNRYGDNIAHVKRVVKALLAQIVDVVSEEASSFVKGSDLNSVHAV